MVLQTGERERFAIHLRSSSRLPRRGARRTGRYRRHHRGLSHGSVAQQTDTLHIVADESHRVRRKRHLHPVFSDKRRHARRLPRLFPRFRNHQGGGRHDRRRHPRQIPRRALHPEIVQILRRREARHLRPEQCTGGRHSRRRDGGLQRHHRRNGRRRAHPAAERQRTQRHHRDDSRHLHHRLFRSTARSTQHLPQRIHLRQQERGSVPGKHPDTVERFGKYGRTHQPQCPDKEERQPDRRLCAERHQQPGVGPQCRRKVAQNS